MDKPNLFWLILYREHQNGTSAGQLAKVLGIPESIVEEHVSAARLCFESKLSLPAPSETGELVYP